jgi:hypothetical protein
MTMKKQHQEHKHSCIFDPNLTDIQFNGVAEDEEKKDVSDEEPIRSVQWWK